MAVIAPDPILGTFRYENVRTVVHVQVVRCRIVILGDTLAPTQGRVAVTVLAGVVLASKAAVRLAAVRESAECSAVGPVMTGSCVPATPTRAGEGTVLTVADIAAGRSGIFCRRIGLRRPETGPFATVTVAAGKADRAGAGAAVGGGVIGPESDWNHGP